MLGFRSQADIAYANEELLLPVAFSAAMAVDISSRHYAGFAISPAVSSDFTITLNNPRMFQVGYIALKQDGTGGRNLTAFAADGYTLGNPDLTGINTAAFKTANITSVLRFQCVQVAGSAIVILNVFVGK